VTALAFQFDAAAEERAQRLLIASGWTIRPGGSGVIVERGARQLFVASLREAWERIAQKPSDTTKGTP
jgi:hypothetical protein